MVFLTLKTTNENNHSLNNINNEITTDYLYIQSAESMGLSFEITGIGARSHAFVIDWHIRFLLATTWLLASGIALFSFKELFNSPWEYASPTFVYLWLIPPAILYFFYHPILETPYYPLRLSSCCL